MKTYSEKLKDPRWQRKRLEILERDNFTCRDCRSESETLHVHHSHYRKGADPWDYEDHHFVSLCENCHGLAEIRRAFILKATAAPHQQKAIYACSGILTDALPICVFQNWIISAAIRFAHHEMDVLMSEDERGMLDSISDMETSAAEIISAVHRVLFNIEAQKENIKESHSEIVDFSCKEPSPTL